MNHPRYWRELPSGAAVPCTMLEWSEYLGSHDQRVRRNTLEDGSLLSTVFLGYDHSWRGDRPMIYETMLFASEEDYTHIACWRYATRESAEIGHERILAALDAATNPHELAEIARHVEVES